MSEEQEQLTEQAKQNTFLSFYHEATKADYLPGYPTTAQLFFSYRNGCINSSNWQKLDKTTKTGTISKEAYTQLEYIVADRICGFYTKEMQGELLLNYGINMETVAREYYKSLIGEEYFIRKGVSLTPYQLNATSHPDAYIIDNRFNNKVLGVLEIKCPTPREFLDLCGQSEEEIISKYKSQLDMHLVFTRALFCDLFIYCPLIPEGQDFILVRYQPTAEYLTQVLQRVGTLDTMADELIEEFTTRSAQHLERMSSLLNIKPSQINELSKVHKQEAAKLLQEHNLQSLVVSQQPNKEEC